MLVLGDSRFRQDALMPGKFRLHAANQVFDFFPPGTQRSTGHSDVKRSAVSKARAAVWALVAPDSKPSRGIERELLVDQSHVTPRRFNLIARLKAPDNLSCGNDLDRSDRGGATDPARQAIGTVFAVRLGELPSGTAVVHAYVQHGARRDEAAAIVEPLDPSLVRELRPQVHVHAAESQWNGMNS